MSEATDKSKSETPSDKPPMGRDKAPLGLVIGMGVAFGLFGFIVGTVATADPMGGVILGVVWGGQAALCTYEGHETTDYDILG